MYYAKIKDEDRIICTYKVYTLDLFHKYDYVFYHSSTEPFLVVHLRSYLGNNGSIRIVPPPTQKKMLLDVLSAVEIEVEVDVQDSSLMMTFKR